MTDAKPGRPKIGGRFEVRLPDEQRAALDAIAEEENTKPPALVREAVDMLIADRHKRGATK